MQNEIRRKNSNPIAILRHLMKHNIISCKSVAKDLDIPYRMANRYLNYLVDEKFAIKDTSFKTHCYEINWEYIDSIRKGEKKNE
ncbi:hypothetical protein [Vallitalea guaymasensis]|uniref:hypothetical protein n=1 Tax=Vallitalea guaymasensis TaxID=1185412 RepID=UPI000DE2F64E|nr:hypothetical protein [Vallitalea guaymasensis]